MSASLRGWVAEWSNAHAWKACLPQGNQGSNPCPSASLASWFRRGGLLLFLCAAPIAAIAESVPSIDPVEKAAQEFLAGDFSAALARLDGMKDGGASQPGAVNLRGSIYLEQGKLAEALASFRAASAQAPEWDVPRVRLGDALLRQKNWAEARTAYEAAIKQTRNLIQHERLRYALLVTYLGEKDEAGAKTALDAVVFPTESPSYYYSQAASAFARGNKRTARKWLKTASRIFDEKETAWFARPLYDSGWIKSKPPLVLN